MSGADRFREAKAKSGGSKSKAGSSRYAKAPQAEYRGYVTYPRSSAQKSQFEAWSSETSDITESMDAAVEMGFKLSVSFDSKDGSCRAQYYSTDVSRDDAGLAVSAFATTVWDSIVLVTFFLAVCGQYRLDGNFFTQPDSVVKKGFWD